MTDLRGATSLDVSDLLVRASLAKTLAVAFGCPSRPDVEELRAGLHRALEAPAARHAPWCQRLAAVAAAWDSVDPEDARREQVALFCGRVPCPPNETSYADGRRVGGRQHELADISGFYIAFGFEIARGHAELQDHIAVELEFLSLLFLKRAWAVHEGLEEPDEIVRDATGAFLDAHLGRWLPAFRSRLGVRGASPVLLATAELAAEVVAEACASHDVHPEPVADDGGASAEPDDFGCPRAAAQEA